jgi:predicted lipoprotein
MKKDYEKNENNEINERSGAFRLFRYFRLFRNPSSINVSKHRHECYPATALLMVTLLCFTACKPWTIRPIDSSDKKPAVSSREFNADAYVDSLWQSKVVPFVIEKAVDLSALLTALDSDFEAAKKQFGRGEPDGPTHFFIKGQGRINRIEQRSQNRTVSIILPNYRGKTEVVLQVGPVFRGTSIRDAVGFFQFNQFVNQLQFADVGNKLNDRVFTTVVNDFDLAAAQGKQVSFYGVFTFSDRSRILITPVKLEAGAKN